MTSHHGGGGTASPQIFALDTRAMAFALVTSLINDGNDL
eukprot:CAMPEP_0201676296 /NCGR_PEP_ID=MMETSP0494-20130426/41498_1 /ASSEMBLY_ACC=CAM_ASM_000839 /TAXON_ID=420259 /ORGANISM="Thalassiosira gravida, Strain GMp14c1" /LENGTH=38 /DNA_ID= /DNA_START= /DNA_END= /DNA_ORIENTATION=